MNKEIHDNKEELELDKKEAPKHFCIFHNVSGKLSFKSRLQILFIGYIKIDSIITVDKEVTVISSKAELSTKKVKKVSKQTESANGNV